MTIIILLNYLAFLCVRRGVRSSSEPSFFSAKNPVDARREVVVGPPGVPDFQKNSLWGKNCGEGQTESPRACDRGNGWAHSAGKSTVDHDKWLLVGISVAI